MSKRAPATSSNATSLSTATYEWTPDEVDEFDTLNDRLHRVETDHEWSMLLGDYIQWGNNKVADHVAIFNMNSGTDCPNKGTESCQVGDDCYAIKSENIFKGSLDYRRRQEYLWDHLDADTWAQAFLDVVGRKRSEVTALRFNQSGDFRDRGDVLKAERIAELLEPHGIDVYTYSASDYINFDGVDHLVVNQSNNRDDYGDKHYTAIPDQLEPEDLEHLDETAVQCPYDMTDGEIDCGDCRLCMESDGPDVYIELH